MTLARKAQAGLLRALDPGKVGPQLGEAFQLCYPALAGLLRLEGTGDATPVREGDAEVVADLLHDLLAPIRVFALYFSNLRPQTVSSNRWQVALSKLIGFRIFGPGGRVYTGHTQVKYATPVSLMSSEITYQPVAASEPRFVREQDIETALVEKLRGLKYAERADVPVGIRANRGSYQSYRERLAPLVDKRIVFIFGECHRSQFGADNPADTLEFDKQMRRKVHYVIKPAHLWASIANLAKNTLLNDWDLLRQTKPAASPRRRGAGLNGVRQLRYLM